MSGMTLVEFLTARLDEDQQFANRAGGQRWREIDEDGRTPDVVDGDRSSVIDIEGTGYLPRSSAAHIARHDPARVLAEVAAKRRIVAEYEAHVRAVGEGLSVPLGRVVRALAVVHAEHPDYREEWKP